MTRALTKAPLFAAMLLMTASAANAETLDETIHKTLPFAAGSRLELSNTNGDVEVSTWDRDEIDIEAHKRVRSSNGDKARQAFEDLQIEIKESASGVTIDTLYPKSPGGWFGNVNSQVSYTIRVPERSDLDIETVNGKVDIEGAEGKIELASTNGGIRVRDAGGSVSARTTNGGIDVELGSITEDEDMTLRTTNGGITLTLPTDIHANLSARTTNGSVNTDFPVTVQGTFRRNRLEGELNGGGATLDLKTTNGSIRIREY
jgi:DUF4097 and DUF4098 domain-containing protein YvlB